MNYDEIPIKDLIEGATELGATIADVADQGDGKGKMAGKIIRGVGKAGGGVAGGWQKGARPGPGDGYDDQPLPLADGELVESDTTTRHVDLMNDRPLAELTGEEPAPRDTDATDGEGRPEGIKDSVSPGDDERLALPTVPTGGGEDEPSPDPLPEGATMRDRLRAAAERANKSPYYKR